MTSLRDPQQLWAQRDERGARSVEEDMQERRRSSRHDSRLRGRIYFDDGRMSVSCLIQDISYEGARIAIFDQVDIPSEIKLCIPEKNRMLRASVRWRHDNRIGLAFSEAQRDVIGKSPPRHFYGAPVPR
jgi:hypothetical protein